MCQVGAGQLDVGTGRNNLIHTMLLFLYRWINFSLMISTFCGSGFDRIGLACWEGSTLVSLASIYFGCWTSRLIDQKWQSIFLHSLVLICFQCLNKAIVNNLKSIWSHEEWKQMLQVLSKYPDVFPHTMVKPGLFYKMYAQVRVAK